MLQLQYIKLQYYLNKSNIFFIGHMACIVLNNYNKQIFTQGVKSESFSYIQFQIICVCMLKGIKSHIVSSSKVEGFFFCKLPEFLKISISFHCFGKPLRTQVFKQKVRHKLLNNAVSALHADLNSINATNLLFEFLKQFVSIKIKVKQQLTS